MTEPRLLLGDCVERLRDLDDASIDAVVCDPPYGLGAEPPIEEVLRAWLAGEVYVPRNRGGFMSKSWDAFVPDLAVWRECFRVLKPGGYLLAFAGTRTVDLIGIGVRLAGFERRDLIAWLYGSGFPKSLDIAKAINSKLGVEGETRARTDGRYAYGFSEAAKKALGSVVASENASGFTGEVGGDYLPASEEATAWNGWGTALKPALEPIVVARKPLVGTVAENVLAHGVGGLNIDACRVAFQSADDEAESKEKNRHGDFGTEHGGNEVYGDYSMLGTRDNYDAPGRWPANVILGHTDDCVLVGYQKVAADGHWPGARPAGSELAGASGHVGQEDLDERAARGETVEVWECSEDCPVRLLDEQTGEISASYRSARTADRPGATWNLARTDKAALGYGDVGGASRFFYTAKTSRAERNAGLEGVVRPTCSCAKEWRDAELTTDRDRSPRRDTGASTAPPTDDSGWSTTSSGNESEGRSPTDTRSTTSTRTSSTTASRTSPSSPLPTISESTPPTTDEQPTDPGRGTAPTASGGSLRPTNTSTPPREGGSPATADRAGSVESSDESRNAAPSASVCPDCGGVIEGAFRNTHPT